jgi:anti-anti-sigma factor
MLEVKVKKLEPIVIVCLQGPVVNGETEALRKAVYSLSDVKAIILDFAGVTMVDAGGLGALLELRASAQSKGIRFELMNVNQWVSKVLEVVKLDTVFSFTSAVKVFPSISRKHPGAMRNLASCA